MIQPQPRSWPVTRVFAPDGPRAPAAPDAGRRGGGAPQRRPGFGDRVERLGHVLRTAFLFAVFGIGAVVLAGGLLPILSRFGGRRADRELVAQRWIHRLFRAFLRLGTAVGQFELSDSGVERLREGAGLVVANHPTLLDVVMLISRLPQADCIVKRAAWRNPFLRGIVSAAGYVPNDDGEALVNACAERLQAGRTVLLFPEGSRSPRGGLGPFKRGAARAALRSGCPITPVVVRCDPPALNKADPHYFPTRKLRFSIAVGEPFEAGRLSQPDEAPAVAARRITRELRSYFEARLDHGCD